MCLGVPMKVIEIRGNNAIAESFGVRTEISIYLVKDELKVGDWVMVHTGYAIGVLEKEDALETLKLIREMVGHGGEN